MIYLFVFFVSILATYFAEYCIRGNNKVAFYLFSSIAILVPSILAGYRDSGVGTDTLIYVDQVYNQVSGISSWHQFIQAYKMGDFASIEFVYLLINFFVSTFFHSLNWLYFFTSLIINLFFYLAAYDNRKKASMWLVMSLFLLLFYNQSLNIVRQTIAISMSLYAFKYIEQKKWLPTLIWCVIILETHNSGIFYVLVGIVYLICQIKGKVKRRVLKSLLVIGVLGALLYLNETIILFVSLGLLPPKFLMYLAQDDSDTTIKALLVMYAITICLYFIFGYLRGKRNSKESKYFFYNKLVGILLFLSSFVSRWGYRIGFYFNVMDCIFIPRVIYKMKRNKPVFYTLNVTLLALAIAVWVWMTVIRNGNETFPYKSKLLGIL